MAVQFLAAANVASSIFGAFSSYRAAKAKRELLRRKAKAARQLGEYNATTTLNNTIGKVNEIQSQVNLSIQNTNRALDKAGTQFSQNNQKMADEYASLVLRTGGNYSSYDYLKSVEKKIFEQQTQFDLAVSEATYQGNVQQKEAQRKSKLVYDLGLANAEIIKYKANLEAMGLETQGSIAEAEGYNQMIAGLGQAAGSYIGYKQDGVFT